MGGICEIVALTVTVKAGLWGFLARHYNEISNRGASNTGAFGSHLNGTDPLLAFILGDRPPLASDARVLAGASIHRSDGGE